MTEHIDQRAVLAEDQPFRLASIAFDHANGEDDRLIEESLKGIGAKAAAKSIWILGWLGDYDKLVATRNLIKREFALDIDAERDSANDAPMFAHFPRSARLSTIVKNVESIPTLPFWRTDGPGGTGFVEVAEAILETAGGWLASTAGIRTSELLRSIAAPRPLESAAEIGTEGAAMNEIVRLKTLEATKWWGRERVYDSIDETIGHTPLVRLNNVQRQFDTAAHILLKLEFFNPLSSVKDRIGVSMLDALEASGTIEAGKTVLVEPTSGNTGIGLAFVAAARGYRLILVMPESMSLERRKILAHLGAELELTPATGGMGGAVARAKELAQSLDNAVIPGQFENPANPLVHERTTAEEIWADTGGRVDVLVVGVGTGGTLTGVGRMLKPRQPNLKIIAVEPEASPLLSKGEKGPHKIQGIGAGFVPDVLDRSLIDEVVTVSNDKAFEIARLLARLEGIPGGISTGANVAAAIAVASRPELAGKTVLTFAPSSAERYFSSDLFA